MRYDAVRRGAIMSRMQNQILVRRGAARFLLRRRKDRHSMLKYYGCIGRDFNVKSYDDEDRIATLKRNNDHD